MPDFIVTDPSGKEFTVTAPDGATQEEALAYAKAQFARPSATQQVNNDAISTDARKTANSNPVRLAIRDAITLPWRLQRAGDIVIGKLADKAGGSIVDAASNAGASPELAAGLGTATNAAVQAAPVALSGAVTGGLGPIATRGAGRAAQVLDDTINAAKDAGYVFPPSTVNPSLTNRALESISGKAATKQAAIAQNQDVTNALMRKALGLPEDTPLTPQTLQQFRDTAASPYKEVASLPVPLQTYAGGRQAPTLVQSPASALEDLKQARFDANDYWTEYKRTGEVAAKNKALVAEAKANELDDYLRQTAIAAGKPELADALANARVQIAKSYAIQRALNPASGNVDARDLGRMVDKGKKLTDELQTAGNMGAAFPQLSGEATKAPVAGVSQTQALASLLSGLAGHAVLGPMGTVAAALPLVSGPTRQLIMSSAFQKAMVNPGQGGLLVTMLEKIPASDLAMLYQSAQQASAARRSSVPWNQ